MTATTDYFSKAKRKWSTTVGGGGIAAGGATLPLASVTGLATDSPLVVIVNPGGTTEEVMKGVISGSNLTTVSKGLSGTSDNPHSAGETVVIYLTEKQWNDMVDGIHVSMNGDGTLKTTAVRTALNLDSGTSTGWTVLGTTPSTVTDNGNRSYDVVFNGTDLTSTISNGMRMLFQRTVAAPTKCTSLNGTNQYYSKTSPAGMTFTDDFTVSAWVKLSSYPGSAGTIISRYNGTSGWALQISSQGQISLAGFNAGSSNFSQVSSYRGLPLNKWVHVAAQLDMSAFTATTTTSYIMIDGVDVLSSVGRGGTNPTALVQAGNLEVGSLNGGTTLFPGKLAQVAVYSAKVTQATIKAAHNQALAGTETNLISAYSFNNSINDLNTSNANNLTANGSAVATAADSPYAQGATAGTLEYAVVMANSFSTNTTVTVQVAEGSALPTSGGISAASYSPHSMPFNFPGQKVKWRLIAQLGADLSLGTTSSTWYGSGALCLVVPVGSWAARYKIVVETNSGSTVYRIQYVTLSTSSTTESDPTWTSLHQVGVMATANLNWPHRLDGWIDVAASTPYYALSKDDQPMSSHTIHGGVNQNLSYIEVQNAWV